MVNRKNAAFTLTELLVTVAIVAILVAIAIPTLPVLLEKARARVCAYNQRMLQSQIAYAVLLADDPAYTAEDAFADLYADNPDGQKTYTCPDGGVFYLEDGVVKCTVHDGTQYVLNAGSRNLLARDFIALIGDLSDYLAGQGASLPGNSVVYSADGEETTYRYLSFSNVASGSKTVTIDGRKVTLTSILEDEFGFSSETLAEAQAVATAGSTDIKVFFDASGASCAVYKGYNADGEDSSLWYFVYPTGDGGYETYAIGNLMASNDAQKGYYAFNRDALIAAGGVKVD